MGSWAYLKIGSVDVGAGYYDIPWESLFLFTEEDFVEEVEADGYEEYRSYYYRTSVEKARATAGKCGLTLDFCDDVFKNYQDDLVFWSDYLEICDDYEIFPELSRTEMGDQERASLIKDSVAKRDQTTLVGIGIDVSGSRMQILKEYIAFKLRRNEPIFPETGTLGEWMNMEDYLTSPLHNLPWQIRSGMLALHHAETLAGSLAYTRLILEAASADDIVELDYGQVVTAMGLSPHILSGLAERAAKRFKLEQRAFSFLVRSNPDYHHLVQNRISSLNEDELIHRVLVPLLRVMGYEDVRPVESHGQGELGRDILPFRKQNEFGMMEYLAIQAKAVKIHGKATVQEGNAAELLNQALTAFRVPFVDPADHEQKRIDRFLIVTNNGITSDARTSIEAGMEKNRKIVFIDGWKLSELIIENDLGLYVLFGDLSLR